MANDSPCLDLISINMWYNIRGDKMQIFQKLSQNFKQPQPKNGVAYKKMCIPFAGSTSMVNFRDDNTFYQNNYKVALRLVTKNDQNDSKLQRTLNLRNLNNEVRVMYSTFSPIGMGKVPHGYSKAELVNRRKIRGPERCF